MKKKFNHAEIIAAFMFGSKMMDPKSERDRKIYGMYPDVIEAINAFLKVSGGKPVSEKEAEIALKAIQRIRRNAGMDPVKVTYVYEDPQA